MCDYSINAEKTRPAKVDDKLTVRMFGWSTRGCRGRELMRLHAQPHGHHGTAGVQDDPQSKSMSVSAMHCFCVLFRLLVPQRSTAPRHRHVTLELSNGGQVI